MKVKHIIAASAVFACATAANAQEAGSFILSGGWTYLAPRGSSFSLANPAAGITKYEKKTSSIVVGDEPVLGQPSQASSFTDTNELANGGMKADSASTFGITGTYFITDNFAAELALNTPAKLSLKGTGELSQFGKVGSVKVWSPALSLKYYFLTAQDKFRPYLGVGVSRTWFTKSEANLPMSVPGSTSLELKDKVVPVLSGGFIYPLSERLSVTASVSYMPLETTATLKTKVHQETTVGSTTTKIDYTRVNSSKFKLNPIQTFVGIGYRF